MDSPTAAMLLCLLLPALVQSAPLPSPSDASPAFREAAERAKLLLEKILRDVATVHTATVTAEGLTLDSSQTSGLHMMSLSLGIPPAPVLKPLSQRFTLDMLVSRMLAGCRQYQGLLGVLSDKLSGLTELNADLGELLTHIATMREAAELTETDETASSDLASRLHGDYEVQVTAHMTLVQLRSFCHDLMRSLRTVAPQRPQAAGTR
ncbi:uncharacterized protein LOC115386623 [Salarias fasciatus]|uniref:uncharacterized protein LOC115386623 n=1 Tax=Salarias fasciatus TaxID=181472 RepID=UPI0011765445|nr:uncharacterized protein LOC115386623 [Salarias fasciatus]